MEDVEQLTTIQLTLKNRRRLAELGSKDDSYDSILTRILDKVDKK